MPSKDKLMTLLHLFRNLWTMLYNDPSSANFPAGIYQLNVTISWLEIMVQS